MRKTATKARMMLITSIWICSHMISDLIMSCDHRSGYLQKSPHMCTNENQSSQAAVSDDLPGYIMA